jgi:branched-chain amino acid transport system permease protein
VVGLPSLRVKGLYLAVATLAANFIVIFVVERPGLAPWTGGVAGIDTPRANLLGWQVDTRREIFALIACSAVLALMAAQNLTQSRVGRAFIAIRERDYSAEILGISLMRTKLAAFAFSAGYCGLAGALFALFYARILPEQFELQLSLLLVAAVIVGGIGRTLGAVLGVVVIVMVPEAIKVSFGAFGDGGADLAAWRAPFQEIAFGALIVGFILYEPHGLARIADRALRAVDRWPFARD